MKTKFVFLYLLISSILMPLFGFETVVGSPIALRVTATKFTAKPNETVTITVTASDQDYVVDEYGYIKQTINDPVTVNITSTSNRLPTVNSVNGNTTKYEWLTPSNPGHYVLTFTAADSGKHAVDDIQKQVLEFTVKNELGETGPFNLTLTASSKSVTLTDKNITVTITAQLRGKDIGEKKVQFFATGGHLSENTGTTNASGTLTTMLTIAPDSPTGAITVSGATENAVSQIYIQVYKQTVQPKPTLRPPTPGGGGNIPKPTYPPYAAEFPISVSPNTLPADGKSTAIVTVQFVDARGIGLANQIVEFSQQGGLIIAPMRTITDRNGYARVQITAAGSPALCLLLAKAGPLLSYVEVLCYDKTENDTTTSTTPVLHLTAAQSIMPGDGATKISIQCLALDKENFVIAREEVEFSTTAGMLSANKMITNNAGIAEIQLTAPNYPAEALITAQVRGVVATVRVTFTDINISAHLPGLEVTNVGTAESKMINENMTVSEIRGIDRLVRQTVTSIDLNGNQKSYDLGVTGGILIDSLNRGYGVVTVDSGGLLTITKIINGISAVAGTAQVPPGSVVKQAYIALGTENIGVVTAMPNNTSPRLLYFISGKEQPVIELNAGMEKAPIIALTANGRLGVFLYGGALQIYDANGQKISNTILTNTEENVLALRFSPNSEKFIAITDIEGGNGVYVYTTANLALESSFRSIPITYISSSDSGMIVSGNDGVARYYNFIETRFIWQIYGNVTGFMSEGDGSLMSIIQNHKPNETIIAIVYLTNGSVEKSQTFENLSKVVSFMPADNYGRYGIIVSDRIMRFLP